MPALECLINSYIYILEFWNETDFIEITRQTDLSGIRCTLISGAEIKSPLSVSQRCHTHYVTLYSKTLLDLYFGV